MPTFHEIMRFVMMLVSISVLVFFFVNMSQCLMRYSDNERIIQTQKIETDSRFKDKCIQVGGVPVPLKYSDYSSPVISCLGIKKELKND